MEEGNEAGSLARGVDVEHARQKRRLIRDHSDTRAVEPDESDDEVPREVLMDLEKLTLVGDRLDQVANLVRLIRTLGDEGVELDVPAIDVIGRRDARLTVTIARWNKR